MRGVIKWFWSFVQPWKYFSLNIGFAKPNTLIGFLLPLLPRWLWLITSTAYSVIGPSWSQIFPDLEAPGPNSIHTLRRSGSSIELLWEEQWGSPASNSLEDSHVSRGVHCRTSESGHMGWPDKNGAPWSVLNHEDNTLTGKSLVVTSLYSQAGGLRDKWLMQVT